MEDTTINNPLKLAFIIDSLRVGGAEKFLISLANNFLENNYQPIIIVLSDEVPLILELNSDIKVYSLPRRFTYDLRICHKIKTVITKEGIEKVFCIDTFPFFLSILPFLFDRKRKFYLSLHHTVPRSIKAYFFDMFYLRFVKSNTTVIYICHNQKEYFKKKYLFNWANSFIIYNGIDTDHFSLISLQLDSNTLRNTCRKKLNIGQEERIIIKVATIRPEKGHLYALDALKVLHTKFNTPAHLIFAGDGDGVYVLKLKTYVKELGLQAYVHFVGQQFDVRPYYVLADIFTLTSHKGETFSLAALEAMSLGLPCSLTDIGGASEMILAHKNGNLSKPREPLSIAQSWSNLLQKKFDSKTIRQHIIENFSTNIMTKNYLNIIK